MTIYIDEDKNIHLYQGDSGNFSIDNLPVDHNYLVYFAISDPDTGKFIADEVVVQSQYRKSANISLNAEFTNKLLIPEGENQATYEYGIKICFGEDENTLIPYVAAEEASIQFKKAPKVFVHRKYAEGNK